MCLCDPNVDGSGSSYMKVLVYNTEGKEILLDPEDMCEYPSPGRNEALITCRENLHIYKI